MPGLDEKAVVSPITDWIERWYITPFLIAQSIVVIVIIVSAGNPELGEFIARIFFPFKWILKFIFPSILRVQFGKMSMDFYGNLLSISAFLSLSAGILMTSLGYFRYRERPARLCHFIIERSGYRNGNVFLFAITVLAIVCVFLFSWMGLVFLGFFSENINVKKSLFEFFLYNFFCSAAIVSALSCTLLPVSYVFYITEKLWLRE